MRLTRRRRRGPDARANVDVSFLPPPAYVSLTDRFRRERHRDSPMAVNTISWKTVERWTQGLIDQECREIRAAFVGDGVTAPQVVWSPTEEGLPTDRQSVVAGKSVSDRIDHGGRR